MKEQGKTMTTATIKVSATSADVMKKYLASVSLPTSGDPGVLSARLAKYYSAEKFDLAECDGCGGRSDATLDECPFCGDAGEVESVDAGTDDSDADAQAASDATQAGKQAETASEASTGAANGQTGPAAPAKKSAKTKPAKKAAAKTKAAKTKPASVSATSAKSKPAKKAAAKVSKKATSKKAAADLAKTAPTEVLTVSMLNDQAKVMQENITAGAVAMHRLGTAAKVIADQGLWKLRTTGKKRTPKFASFKQFCTEELGIHHTGVYRAIKAATLYTEEQVQGLTGRALSMSFALPADKREKLLDAARNGESTAQLSQTARELSGRSDPVPEPTNGVSIAVAMGEQVINLFARGEADARVGETDGCDRAMSLTEDPWFVVPFTNNVQMIGRIIKEADGMLQVALTMRQGEEI